jgi:hypothetical protein
MQAKKYATEKIKYLPPHLFTLWSQDLKTFKKLFLAGFQGVQS